MNDIVEEIINNTKCPGCNILLKDSNKSKCKHGFEYEYNIKSHYDQPDFIIYFYKFNVLFYNINYKDPSNLMSLTININIINYEQIQEIYDLLPNNGASLDTFQSTIDIAFKYIENLVFS